MALDPAKNFTILPETVRTPNPGVWVAQGSSGGGVTINSPGGLNPGSLGVNDTQALEQQFEQAVHRGIQKTGLLSAIPSGNTG